jgi:hypothetical protein
MAGFDLDLISASLAVINLAPAAINLHNRRKERGDYAKLYS